MKKRDCSIYVAETKGADQLRGVTTPRYHTAQLICAFVFAIAKIRFSYDAAHISALMPDTVPWATLKSSLTKYAAE